MEFALFKGLLGLLFFGFAFAVGFLQLAAIKQCRLPEHVVRSDPKKPSSDRNTGH